MTNHELSIYFFLQLAVILATCRGVAWLAKRVGQPPVVAEMVAGVLLGPSFFGLLFPGLYAQVFPPASKTIIYSVSQVGLVLYMFLVGVEFNVAFIQKGLRCAMTVSAAGIAAPFMLGCLLAVYMLGQGTFFAEGVKGWEAMLFLGAAMSVTSLPMLARIIHERGLASSPLGTLALAAGAVDDAVAWCLLAAVVASFSHDLSIAMWAICGGLAYVLAVFFLIRPLLRRMGESAERSGGLTAGMFSLILIMVMLGAGYTDAIRIYAVFGAFILGTAMPRGVVARDLGRLLQPLTKSFLLPLFFVYSGLNTRLSLVDSPYMWGMALLVLFAASFGKGIACWLVARANGQLNHNAVAIGALMNARGLMELIILNIGLERGLITPTLFSIMVIMAIVTTLAATPVFEFAFGRVFVPPSTQLVQET